MAKDLTYNNLIRSGSMGTSDNHVPSCAVVASSIASVSITTASITSVSIGQESVNTSTITTATIDFVNIGESTINTASISTASINTVTINNDIRYVNLVDVATETSSGVTGQVVFGTSSIFVCTATDTWKKVDYGSW